MVKFVNDNNAQKKSYAVAISFLTGGVILIIIFVFYNEFITAVSDRINLYVANKEFFVERTKSIRLYILLAGFILISISKFEGRIKWPEIFINKRISENALLYTLCIFLAIFILELSLRPIMELISKTTIFIQDSKLGWKLRPDCEDVWGGVRVNINGKGLRGPELDYTKPDNSIRLLYLGDSITFGYKLRTYKQTFPYLVESILENRLSGKLETINAGIGGYSPWQEYIYLADEGIKYNPDIVIVSFALNDVGETFNHGKKDELTKSHQLSKTLFSNSILGRLRNASVTMHILRNLRDKIIFGDDNRWWRERDELGEVEYLILHPNRPFVKRIWKRTLKYLGNIFDFCHDRNIPVILVVFPFTFQFNNLSILSGPQKIVTQYAIDKKIPVIDLLPILSEKMKEEGLKSKHYFLDHDHLSPLGSEVVSGIIADYILDLTFLPVAE